MLRRLTYAVTIAMCAVALLGAQSASVSVQARVPMPARDVKLSQLAATPQPYNPLAGLETISFRLNTTADVSAAITGPLGVLVAILPPTLQLAGPGTLVWNGRDLLGNLVAPSWYSCRVLAENYKTSSTTTCEIAVSYGATLTLTQPIATPANFDPARTTTRLSANASRDAFVSLTITAVKGSRTVRSWSEAYFPVGTLGYTWDGRDSKGRSLAPGSYTLKFSGHDSGGNLATATGTVTILGP